MLNAAAPPTQALPPSPSGSHGSAMECPSFRENWPCGVSSNDCGCGQWCVRRVGEGESARLRRPTPPQRRCIHNCEKQLRVERCTRHLACCALHPQLSLAIASAHEVARHPFLHVRIIDDDRPRVTGDSGEPQIIHRPRRPAEMRTSADARGAFAQGCAACEVCAVCQVYKSAPPRDTTGPLAAA